MPEPDRRQARRLSGCPGAQILKTWEAMTRMDRRLMVVTTTRGFPSSAILKSCTLRSWPQNKTEFWKISHSVSPV
jgi:hypothetical protein